MAIRIPRSFIVAVTWAAAVLALVALGVVCWRALAMGEPVWKVVMLALVGVIVIPVGTKLRLGRSLRRAERAGQL